MLLYDPEQRTRANVVLELINTERDYVKHLRDVVEGYLYPARRRPEIFTSERINTIFANIEQLHEFHQEFLKGLETCINWDDPAKSEVGKNFINYEEGFSLYHYYCNNHPNAISELQELHVKPLMKERFDEFFRACRLQQNMIDLSLGGFLLAPIQRICKYPLLLHKLLKNTEKDHADFHPVANALESMRNCANLTNERTRRIEALADVMSFQEKVDNWFGPKLCDTSSILIHSGEVCKMTNHNWSQGVQLYLFDHLLLYSKKDLLKRNNLILKGRICMDTISEISDADEFKPKKSFKLYCSEQQKWFVFTTRSEKEKDEWIKAFERERNLVESDENEGFQITDREITIARRALRNRKRSTSARYRHKRPDTAVEDQLDLDDPYTIMNRTLSLPSCIHPHHVMNFVEDSRVVASSSTSSSSRSKKVPSPLDAPKSLNNSSSHLDEGGGNVNQQEATPQSGASWFRKVGSKKLAKSQVYNINGENSSSSFPLKLGMTSPVTAIAAAAVFDSVAVETGVSNVTTATMSNNYDQLEKRYREHMVSEEQARLFRLNNDMSHQPQIHVHRKPMNRTNLSPENSYLQPDKHSNQLLNSQEGGTSNSIRRRSTDSCQQQVAATLDSLRLNSDSSLATTCTYEQHAPHAKSKSFVEQDNNLCISQLKPSQGTFEATVMLSSGKVVTVKEDAV